MNKLWKLGDHRLMCADCTEESNVKLLFDSEKADMVFTDPPYGVNLKSNGGKSIMGDLSQVLIPFSFDLSVNIATKDKAWFYFCGTSLNAAMYSKILNRYLFSIPQIIVWKKNGFVFRHNGYHSQFEFIFYGFKQGGGGRWFGGRKEHEASDVWEIKKDASKYYLHPTQKPVELPARAIRNSSDVGMIVYDPFCGSGSTLIACEDLKRRCYAIEIDPYYCDVIIKRWESATGKKAELLQQFSNEEILENENELEKSETYEKKQFELF
jgi:DNA modification methylase